MMFKNPAEYKPGEVLIPRQTIHKRLLEMAQSIAFDYKNTEVLIIPIMKGSFMVLADLIRELYNAGLDVRVSTVTVGSYGSGTVSSKQPKFKHEIDIDVKNKHILLVEDIVDTGHTLQLVTKELQSRGSASIKCFSLLSKPSRREIQIEAEYIGFVIPNIWVQGYGLDNDELGRGNPDIIVGPFYLT